MTLKEIRAAMMEVVGSLVQEDMDKMLDLMDKYTKLTGRNVTFAELERIKKEYGLDSRV